jgi:leucyl aminopeptidase
MQIKIKDKNPPNTLAIPLASTDSLSERLTEIAHLTGLERDTLQIHFTGKSKEILPLLGPNNKQLYLIGLGNSTEFSQIQNSLRYFSHHFKTKLPETVGLDLRHFPEKELSATAEACLSGIILGLYETGKYQTTTPKGALFNGPKAELILMVRQGTSNNMQQSVDSADIFSNVYTQIFDLVNAPGNFKTPEDMQSFASQAAKEFGFSIKILDHKFLEKNKLNAICAVGKGSPHPPRLLLLEYLPKLKKKIPTIGLVGKGVTFDSGGISIKPSTNMHLMKSDMGGAAAVLGTFMATAAKKLPVRLTGAIPIVENMVDGNALKPGDVIHAYNGKSIEVTDTDAEGRLILADAIAYLLKQDSPEILIDLATLTGSIVRAIGNHAAGLFTKNDELCENLINAGNKSGEKLWRMPMWEEYGTDLKSNVADLRNFTGKPTAESIAAAKFLEHFTNNHPAWAHLDIAGTAFTDSDFSTGKSATGFGIRLLTNFVEQYASVKK